MDKNGIDVGDGKAFTELDARLVSNDIIEASTGRPADYFMKQEGLHNEVLKNIGGKKIIVYVPDNVLAGKWQQSIGAHRITNVEVHVYRGPLGG